ncbi:hypothetical protein DFJ74DRAFT_627859 [Hyaloraphidium curvatum]|nr:hypothetical protein DFJ74DRAFT_627859 [Hyaloraphidium curvatum]
MNFLFDGDPRKRRNVNLGGASASRATTKSAVVADTRAARAARDLEARQHRSARKIQAFFRGRTAVARARKADLAAFDSAFAGARASGPTGPADLLELVRRFTFLGLAEPNAAKRVAEFGIWLGSLLSRGIPRRSAPSSPWLTRTAAPSTVNEEMISGDLAWRWLHQLKRFTSVCLGRLKAEAARLPPDSRQLEQSLKALLVVTDPAVWPSGDAAPGRPRRQALLSHMVSIGTYSLLRNILALVRAFSAGRTPSSDPPDSLKSLDDQAPSTLATQLCFRLLNPDSPDSLIQFSISILALPAFDSLPKATLDLIRRLLPFGKLAAALRSSSPLPTTTIEESANLLAGLVLAVGDRVPALPADELAAVLDSLRLLAHSLPRTAFGYSKPTAAIRRSAVDDDDDMDIDEPPRPGPARPAEPPFNPRLRQRVLSIVDPEFLRAIASRAPDIRPTEAASAGLFFLELMTRSRTARDAVLTAVAASASLMRKLWSSARSLGLAAKFLKGQATDADKDALSGLLGPLSGGYSRRLVTMDDADFSSGEARGVFAVSDVVELSAVLRDVAVHLHVANRQPGTTGDRLVALRREATVVLRDLHDWDARRSFCPPGHWLHATVDVRVDTLPLNLFDIPDEDVLDEPDTPADVKPGGAQSANARSVQLLRHLPFVIPFPARVRLFQRLLDQDASTRVNSYEQVMGSVFARVRRPYLYEDGFEKLADESSRLKGRIRIQLIDEHGLEEAGIDGGGLFKEFLTELLKRGFDPALGFFRETPQNLLYPNPEAFAVHGPEALRHFEFLGKMVGKAVYERILVELPFAQFFLRKMLKRPCSIGDLSSLDPELSKNLVEIKNYRGDFSDLGLTFSVTDNALGQPRTVDLIPNGRNVEVTAENRLQFVYLWANYRLNVSIRAQCEAFLRGMQALIEPAWLQMFDERELQVLISGAEVPVDVEDLRHHTAYSGGYSADHPTISIFWEVVRGFGDAERRKLLRFATSCSRPPLLGFRELHPQFCIHSAGRESEDRLPTASTCMNLLKLPPFRDRDTMKKKLLYAIEAGAGFDLS